MLHQEREASKHGQAEQTRRDELGHKESSWGHALIGNQLPPGGLAFMKPSSRWLPTAYGRDEIG
jgi:hypothetical protein